MSVRDLGERRLKDLEQPQRLYQLDVDGLQNEFAQLRTLDVELRRKRRRVYAGSALIGVLAAAVAIPVFALGQGGSDPGVTVEGNAVAVIDPDSNRVTDAISVGIRPGAIASGSGALWVANRDDQSVSRIDPGTNSVTKAIPVVDTPTGLAAVDGATWVVGSDDTGPSVSLRRIDPQFDTVAPKIRSTTSCPAAPARRRRSARPSGSPRPPACSPDWTRVGAASSTRSIRTRAQQPWPSEQTPPGSPTATPEQSPVSIHRADTPITVGGSPSAIAVGAGGVWVANRGDDTVVRIDPSTGP